MRCDGCIVEGDLRLGNAMRSEEHKGKNETQESGDATLSEVRGYDAEGRGVLGQILEVPEQEVSMADVGELGGEMSESAITFWCFIVVLACVGMGSLIDYFWIQKKKKRKKIEKKEH